MSEVFKTIQGYEGLYEVSNYGNVKSLARDVEWRGTIRHYPERILKPSANNCGYLYVNLCMDGKAKHHQVHRLVASAFIDNPDNLPQVNHKDEVKTHNSVLVNEDGTVDFSKSNLEWVSTKENINHGTRNQRVSEANLNGKLSIPVDMLTKEGEQIRTFPSAHEAERWLRNNGYPSASHVPINKCCKGNPKYNTAYGFKWRYSQCN